jgi:tetratricopeptide (TPR) repeat protein
VSKGSLRAAARRAAARLFGWAGPEPTAVASSSDDQPVEYLGGTDTATLESVAAACRGHLKSTTRQDEPHKWAMLNHHLGSALQVLGERDGGTAQLTEAAAAYREALKEFTRERLPLEWARSQFELGTTLHLLGAREPSATRLHEAIVAFRNALEVRTREREPLDWAATLNGLGNALRALGQRESGTGYLEEAVATYHAAFDVFLAEKAMDYVFVVARNLLNAQADLDEREALMQRPADSALH